MIEKIIPDIPKIRAHWERRSCLIPYLMVPMSDGRIIRYNPEIQQSSESLNKALESIRNMATMAGGYPPGPDDGR